MNNKRTYTVYFRRKSCPFTEPVRSIIVKAVNAEEGLREARKTQNFDRETWHSLYRGGTARTRRCIATLDLIRRYGAGKSPDLSKF